jgi:hypothetical protein
MVLVSSWPEGAGKTAQFAWSHHTIPGVSRTGKPNDKFLSAISQHFV